MITETTQHAHMEITVTPVWVGPDILVHQKFRFSGPLAVKDPIDSWLELSVGQAEALIVELQNAIARCRAMDAQYEEDMRAEEARKAEALQDDSTSSAREVQI